MSHAGSRVKLPPLRKSVLSNGLKVIVVEQHSLPTVTVALMIKSGSGCNPLRAGGLASITADMILLGTPTRSAEQIAEQIDSLGATMSAVSGWDSTSLTAAALSTDLEVVLDLLTDFVRNPSLPESELALLEQRRANELQTKLDKPAIVANDMFAEALYPDHPYGLPQDGTVESIRSIARENVVEFHAQHFIPQNSLLIVAGDVDPAHALERIETLLGSWTGTGGGRKRRLSSPPDDAGTRIVLVDREDLTQTQLRIGHAGIARSNSDWFSVQVANYILGGGGFSSRLLDRIRVQKGYTYGLNSSFQARSLPGPFVISTFTPHETVPEVILETIDVMREFRDQGAAERELADAKNFFVSGYPRSFETPAGVAAALIEVELYGLGDGYIETYQDRFASVTADQVRAAASRYMDTRNLLIVCVTKADEVADRLEAMGPSLGQPFSLRLTS